MEIAKRTTLPSASRVKAHPLPSMLIFARPSPVSCIDRSRPKLVVSQLILACDPSVLEDSTCGSAYNNRTARTAREPPTIIKGATVGAILAAGLEVVEVVCVVWVLDVVVDDLEGVTELLLTLSVEIVDSELILEADEMVDFEIDDPLVVATVFELSVFGLLLFTVLVRCAGVSDARIRPRGLECSFPHSTRLDPLGKQKVTSRSVLKSLVWAQ